MELWLADHSEDLGKMLGDPMFWVILIGGLAASALGAELWKNRW